MTTAAATGSRPAPLLAWMRLMRVSNAPTVVTNAMVGMAVAMTRAADPVDVVRPGVTAAAGCVLVYLAGMMMNDYFDQPMDRRERPGRPIVSGAVREQAAIVSAMAMLAAGAGCMAWTGPATVPWMLLLVSSVLAYNMLHRSPLAGPPLMAACRALVPTTVAIAASPGHQPDWHLLAFFALPLGVSTLAISLAARHEAADPADSPHAGVRLSMAAALLGAAAMMPLGAVAVGRLPPTGDLRIVLYACCMVATAWMVVRGMFDLVDPRRVPQGVMTWIAALGVIDAGSLVLLARTPLAAAAVAGTLLARWMQRRIAGS